MPSNSRRVNKNKQEDSLSCGVFACFHAINHFDDSDDTTCNPYEYRLTMAITILNYIRDYTPHDLPLLKCPLGKSGIELNMDIMRFLDRAQKRHREGTVEEEKEKARKAYRITVNRGTTHPYTSSGSQQKENKLPKPQLASSSSSGSQVTTKNHSGGYTSSKVVKSLNSMRSIKKSKKKKDKDSNQSSQSISVEMNKTSSTKTKSLPNHSTNDWAMYASKSPKPSFFSPDKVLPTSMPRGAGLLGLLSKKRLPDTLPLTPNILRDVNNEFAETEAEKSFLDDLTSITPSAPTLRESLNSNLGHRNLNEFSPSSTFNLSNDANHHFQMLVQDLRNDINDKYRALAHRVFVLESNESTSVKPSSKNEICAKSLRPAVKEYVIKNNGGLNVADPSTSPEFVDLLISKLSSGTTPVDQIEVSDMLEKNSKAIKRDVQKGRSAHLHGIKKELFYSLNELNVAISQCSDQVEDNPHFVLQSLLQDDRLFELMDQFDDDKNVNVMLNYLWFFGTTMRKWAVEVFCKTCAQLEMPVNNANFALIISVAEKWLFAKSHARNLDHNATYERSYVIREEIEIALGNSDSDTVCFRKVSLPVQLDEANTRLNSLSLIEVQEKALISKARYLIFKCDDGNCITTHSQACKLSGISVSKTNENKVREKDEQKNKVDGKVIEKTKEQSTEEEHEETSGKNGELIL